MAAFLLAAIKTLAIPVDAPCSPSATDPPAAPASPRASILSASASAAPKPLNSAVLDLNSNATSTEAVADNLTPSLAGPIPLVSVAQPSETLEQLMVAMSPTAVTPAQPADDNSMETSTADNSPRTALVTVPPALQESSPSRSPSPDFGVGDFHFVPFVDAMDNDDWLLIPEEFKSLTDADATANFSTVSLVDSFDNTGEDPSVPHERADLDTTPYQNSESLGSFELDVSADSNFEETQCREDNSSLSSVQTTSPRISLLSSENDDVDFPETSDGDSEDDTCSDRSGIGFRELFNDPNSEELDWEEDYFHDCGDEFSSEMNESFYSEDDSEPLLPPEENLNCVEECLTLLFYEEENDLDDKDHKILDVVEELQPTEFSAVSSGYPVKDLPILEGNFFQLADTPPYEEAAENERDHTHNGAMFLFEIPGKCNEETVVQDMGNDVITSFISGHEFSKCDIMFGDFDSLPPSPPETQNSPDAMSPTLPCSSNVTPSSSSLKSMSLSSLPSSEAILSTSSDCSCMTCPSPTLSSEFFPCTDNLTTENEVDQLDSLEEKCFKLDDENDVDASFDCFPMRLQSARKVDYRGCGTRKTRRMRKRW